MLRNLVISAVVLCAASIGTASAAVTVYPVNIFSQTGVTNAGNALGAPDGAAAVIGNGGSLVLEFNRWLVGNTARFDLVANGVFAAGAVSIGHVVGGVATFSAESNFNTIFGAGIVQTFDLSTQCAAISVNGCSLVRIRTTNTFFSSGIALDGLTSSAPEPGAWALMIVGFIAMAGRLKMLRRSDRIGALAIAR